jgi:hypothetical protein
LQEQQQQPPKHSLLPNSLLGIWEFISSSSFGWCPLFSLQIRQRHHLSAPPPNSGLRKEKKEEEEEAFSCLCFSLGLLIVLVAVLAALSPSLSLSSL